MSRVLSCLIIHCMATGSSPTQQHAREWRLEIAQSFETETSVISYVSRDGQSLVLKVVKQQCDEWNAGEVLNAFDGHGVVRVYEHTGGAMLLERLQPGTSLVNLALDGRDEEATDILAGVIKTMSAREVPDDCPTVAMWGKGFDRYLVNEGKKIPRPLVESARQVFTKLVSSQRQPRLLHGDLHHHNVLSDANRGWVAIDPKGVIGETEYEIGAALRNPIAHPELFLSPPVIERRLNQFTKHLALDYERTLAWTFAQAVLSAIWEIEDGSEVSETNSALKLARIIQPMLAE
jgi:streptomycin 6-kinase